MRTVDDDDDIKRTVDDDIEFDVYYALAPLPLLLHPPTPHDVLTCFQYKLALYLMAMARKQGEYDTVWLKRQAGRSGIERERLEIRNKRSRSVADYFDSMDAEALGGRIKEAGASAYDACDPGWPRQIEIWASSRQWLRLLGSDPSRQQQLYEALDRLSETVRLPCRGPKFRPLVSEWHKLGNGMVILVNTRDWIPENVKLCRGVSLPLPDNKGKGDATKALGLYSLLHTWSLQSSKRARGTTCSTLMHKLNVDRWRGVERALLSLQRQGVAIKMHADGDDAFRFVGDIKWRLHDARPQKPEASERAPVRRERHEAEVQVAAGETVGATSILTPQIIAHLRKSGVSAKEST